jgi:hypothetical protein
MRIIILAIALLGTIPGRADDLLNERISRLLLAIETSNCQFVRNGKTYTATDSIAHIRKKHRHFKDDIDSIDRFIELSASRSLISGRPYQVQCGSSEPELSSAWLSKKAIELGINN